MDEAKKYLENGKIKKNKSDYAGAVADFNQAIEIDPNNAEAYYSRGCVKYSHINNKPGGMADFNKALELNPQFANAYGYRGHAKVDLNDYEGGIVDFTRAIELNHKDSGSYFGRACAKKDTGDINGAIDDFRIADELGFDGAYETMLKILPTPFMKHMAAIKRQDKSNIFSRFQNGQYKEHYCRMLSGKKAVQMLYNFGRISEEEAKYYGGSIETFYFDNLGEKEAFFACFGKINTDHQHALINDLGEQIL